MPTNESKKSVVVIIDDKNNYITEQFNSLSNKLKVWPDYIHVIRLNDQMVDEDLPFSDSRFPASVNYETEISGVLEKIKELIRKNDVNFLLDLDMPAKDHDKIKYKFAGEQILCLMFQDEKLRSALVNDSLRITIASSEEIEPVLSDLNRSIDLTDGGKIVATFDSDGKTISFKITSECGDEVGSFFIEKPIEPKLTSILAMKINKDLKSGNPKISGLKKLFDTVARINQQQVPEIGSYDGATTSSADTGELLKRDFGKLPNDSFSEPVNIVVPDALLPSQSSDNDNSGLASNKGLVPNTSLLKQGSETNNTQTIFSRLLSCLSFCGQKK
jgi:hypothetical protein